MALFEDKVKVYSPRLQKDVGIKGFQADGFFGNFGEESNGFTQLHQVGGNGRGWAQWDDRRHAFEAFCASKGFSPESDEGNYQYLVHELLTTEHAALLAVRATHTRDEATETVMRKFERPGVPALDVRIHWAIRAEAARLEQEKTMTDTSGVVTQPTPAASSSENVLADWIIKNEVPAETALRAIAVAKGLPGFAIDMVFQLVNPIINQAIQNLHPEDIAKLILPHLLGGIQSLVSHVADKQKGIG